ncbi:hypothetical protein [Actinomadura geliboluensis]|uniref:hypothetical protein n=1 Tax=Actinomadura geliboluensis TaxID=882440 RepID=UPI002618AE24|nr:hypothetical protein [Actinomadura geliboluensis]
MKRIFSASASHLRWWTFSGYRANAVLTVTLSDVTDEAQRFDGPAIRLRTDPPRRVGGPQSMAPG